MNEFCMDQSHLRWRVAEFKVLDNRTVEFIAEHIETGERETLQASRGNWESGIGELIDLYEYGL